MKNKLFIITAIIFLLLVFIAIILTPIYKKAPVKKAFALKGKIAIVIDDWGYHLNNLPIVENITQPLTCAVLPNLNNSVLVSQRLNKLGFEIILHLPMQPKEKYNLEKNTISLDMDEPQISKIINKDLASVIFAKGVSNHMGSAITENGKICLSVMKQIKKHKLYFLDSFVTAKSLAWRLAREMKIKSAKRDVFLDNQNNPEYIKAQLIKLKNLAKKQGYAVGIGHDRRNTLLVLKEMLPQIQDQGYQFVFVSEIVQ